MLVQRTIATTTSVALLMVRMAMMLMPVFFVGTPTIQIPLACGTSHATPKIIIIIAFIRVALQ